VRGSSVYQFGLKLWGLLFLLCRRGVTECYILRQKFGERNPNSEAFPKHWLGAFLYCWSSIIAIFSMLSQLVVWGQSVCVCVCVCVSYDIMGGSERRPELGFDLLLMDKWPSGQHIINIL
jgi:hypothetical protein